MGGRTASSTINSGRRAVRAEVQPPVRWIGKLLWHFRQLDPVAQIGFIAAIFTMIFAAVAVLPVLAPPPAEADVNHHEQVTTQRDSTVGGALVAGVGTPITVNVQADIDLRAQLDAAVDRYMAGGDAKVAIAEIRAVIDRAELSTGSGSLEAAARRWVATIMKHDDPAAAMRELRFATKIYPNDPSLWMERGEMAREMNEVQEAADSYAKARQLAGNEPRLMPDHTNELVAPPAADDTRKSGSSEVPRLIAPATQESGGRPS